jgi:CheY-like chemotaxis protein
VKYTNPGGEIRVRHYSAAHQAVIEIVDSGVGISPELLPHIFELFVQGDRTLDRSQGGLGVGLAICKQLIEMHRGTVTAHSDGIGRGATFEIRLPLAEAPAETDNGSRVSSGHTRRVLIVDDNQDAADSLAVVLRFEGHETSVAYSAQTAIEAVGASQPEVVLLDIGLPHMDGYEVARRIRASGASARIIALTGYGQLEDRQRSAAAGFAAHLVKPVDIATLVSMLSNSQP